MDITQPETVSRFFNGAGRIASFPRRPDRKLQLLEFLAGQFEAGRVYLEPEVNDILEKYYDDYPYLRRSLIEFGLLQRDAAIGSYWLAADRT